MFIKSNEDNCTAKKSTVTFIPATKSYRELKLPSYTPCPRAARRQRFWHKINDKVKSNEGQKILHQLADDLKQKQKKKQQKNKGDLRTQSEHSAEEPRSRRVRRVCHQHWVNEPINKHLIIFTALIHCAPWDHSITLITALINRRSSIWAVIASMKLPPMGRLTVHLYVTQAKFRLLRCFRHFCSRVYNNMHLAGSTFMQVWLKHVILIWQSHLCLMATSQILLGQRYQLDWKINIYIYIYN